MANELKCIAVGGTPFAGKEIILDYLEKNRSLLNDRPHGWDKRDRRIEDWVLSNKLNDVAKRAVSDDRR